MCAQDNLGFTLIELLVTMLIAVTLAALLIAILPGTLKSVKQTQSLGNLKAIGQGIMSYSNDNQSFLPLMCSTDGWASPLWCEDAIPPYLNSKTIRVGTKNLNALLIDPLVNADRHGSLGDYAANADVLRGYPSYPGKGPLALAALGGRMSKVMMVLAGEDGTKSIPPGMWYINPSWIISNPMLAPSARPSDRGSGNILAVFADGHTEAVSTSAFTANPKDYLLVNP